TIDIPKLAGSRTNPTKGGAVPGTLLPGKTLQPRPPRSTVNAGNAREGAEVVSIVPWSPRDGECVRRNPLFGEATVARNPARLRLSPALGG
ncbi:MAG: hypothetical protein ABSD20_14130, partial [Terriglobales bacterium]